MFSKARLLGSLSLGITIGVAALSIAAGVQAPAPGESNPTNPTNPTIQPGHVLGIVTSADAGADLGRVVVTLVRDGKPFHRTVTNKDGKFAFPVVRPGPFVVVAEKHGVGVGRTLAGVKPGETVKVSVELKKPTTGH